MLLDRLVWLGCIPWLVHSLASTDELSDADPAQSGYLPNHNMQPSIVDSSGFGILWSQTFNAKELWYAKPLVYTAPGQKQLVFTASNQNWIRTFDAVTGTLIQARQVQPPFLQSDVGCIDMPNTIGECPVCLGIWLCLDAVKIPS
jgi:iron transport multicopper oxidase